MNNTYFPGQVSAGGGMAVGGDAAFAANVRVARNLRVDGWLEAANVRTPAVGLFPDEAALRMAYPVPHDGWWALVGASLPAAVWAADHGAWVATGGVGGEPTVESAQARADIEVLQARADRQEENAVLATRGLALERGRLAVLDEHGAFLRYGESSTFDTVRACVPPMCGNAMLRGVSVTRCNFFSAVEPSAESHLGSNTTGEVPEGAVLAMYSLRRSDNAGGYAGAWLDARPGYAAQSDVDRRLEPLERMVEQVADGRNLLDPEAVLRGWVVSNGMLKPSEAGILSGRLRLERGKAYAYSKIGAYGTPAKVFVAMYDRLGEYAGRLALTPDRAEGGYAWGSFVYEAAPEVDHVRFVLQSATSGAFDPAEAQIEEGEATEHEPYRGHAEVVLPEAARRKVRVLAIGNSYSQDMLAYAPWVLRSVVPEVDFEIGMLVLSSSTLAQHAANLRSGAAVYTYYLHDGGAAWSSLGLKSIGEVVAERPWHLVMLQQASTYAHDWSTYEPHLTAIIDAVKRMAVAPVRFGWQQTMTRYKGGETVYTQAEVEARAAATAQCANRVLAETEVGFVARTGAAVQRARATVLDGIGDYGHLLAADGGHLQEGLPSLLAAYCFCVPLVEAIGYGERSISGEGTRPTAAWLADKAIPGPHGASAGVTDDNCLLAQRLAILAAKG